MSAHTTQPPAASQQTPLCIYKVPGADGRQVECGRPATWRRHLVTLCQAHAEDVSSRFALERIGGLGELDRRPVQRIVRRYLYPSKP